MTAVAAANGRIGAAPKQIKTKTGRPMTIASMAVTGASTGEDATLWLSLVAFGHNAEHLERFKKGDAISVMGRMVLNVWQPDGGERREQLQLVVDQIQGLRPVPRAKAHPRTEDKRGGYHAAQPPGDLPFDDKLSF